MSAEQMRVELESFVNRGLREGLKGWPVKTSSAQGQESPRTYCTMPTAVALFHGVQEGPLPTAGLGLPREQGPIASDIRPAVKFCRKSRFGVTADGLAPLYW